MKIEIDIDEESKIVTVSKVSGAGVKTKMAVEGDSGSTLDEVLKAVPGLFNLYYSKHSAHCSHQI